MASMACQVIDLKFDFSEVLYLDKKAYIAVTYIYHPTINSQLLKSYYLFWQLGRGYSSGYYIYRSNLPRLAVGRKRMARKKRLHVCFR
jgi:hypothetical protein